MALHSVPSISQPHRELLLSSILATRTDSRLLLQFAAFGSNKSARRRRLSTFPSTPIAPLCHRSAIRAVLELDRCSSNKSSSGVRHSQPSNVKPQI
ncbi:hypothetical protein HN51_035632 [Arachis hypogaea]